MVWLSDVLLFQNITLVTVDFEALNVGIDSAFIPNGMSQSVYGTPLVELKPFIN